MAIDFPSDRATNDTYTYNNKTWLWNGEAWELSASTETGNTEGNTGEFAYYDVKGSVIKGATGFHYNATTLGISCAGVLYAGGGITSGDNLSVAAFSPMAPYNLLRTSGDLNFGPKALQCLFQTPTTQQ